MDKSIAKQYESLSRNISSLLKDFEKNREWADINNWLSRLMPLLAGKKLPDLPHKVTLAKRLAQCLNSSLPAGVHSNALNVYSTLLNNFGNKAELLPLMSIGLFPFFECSSSGLKLELIKIFDMHFIESPESLQMATPLMNALLTGLIENNEELARKIYQLCDKFSMKYGRLWIDGAVWINILKSPKVRIAGFKYFTKSFKDRDKKKISKNSGSITEEIKSPGSSPLKVEGQLENRNEAEEAMQPKLMEEERERKDSFTQVKNPMTANENPQEQKMLSRLLQTFQSMEDNDAARFPNFSTLVVNAICECLQCQQADHTLVKRSALDLMIFHLKLENKELICEKDAVQLILVMLQLVKAKEYSLTRRIYTYLFGQPDMEGVYSIDIVEREYEIGLLKMALLKLLKNSESKAEKPLNERSIRKNSTSSLPIRENINLPTVMPPHEVSLMIFEILIKDHPKINTILLPPLAFSILEFLQHESARIPEKRLCEFYSLIIQPNKEIFLFATLNKMLSEEVVTNIQTAEEVIQVIDFYTIFKKRLANFERANDKEEIVIMEGKDILPLVEWMLKYLQKTNCEGERVSVQILELSQKFINYLPEQNRRVNEESVKLLDELISSKRPNSIFAGLLTLHPMPSKEILLPFINEISLSTVCIENLLHLDNDVLTESERESLFFAAFRLLNCHLWEDQAVDFIKRYHIKYAQQYSKLIDFVEPSEWLIYWRKLNGDVQGGVIRMLKNLEDQNPLNRQLSKKWLQSSKQIVSKVVDPIYSLMNQPASDSQPPSEEDQLNHVKSVFNMIRNVFIIQKKDFTTFFFLQREKYFLPLVDKVFVCLHSSAKEFKSEGMKMLQFLLERANSLDEKLAFLSLTFNDTLALLKEIIEDRQMEDKYLREIEILDYFRIMVDIFASFKGGNEKVELLKQMLVEAEMYEIMGMGMRETPVAYVRTQYIDFIHDSCEVLIKVTEDRKHAARIVNKVLQILFFMLRENDITTLEQIIRGKELASVNRRKKSVELPTAFEQHQISATEFNVESKYAQIIELWNSVKFFVNISINNEVEDLPIEQLLSLILQSFPFSYLKYDQISTQFMQEEYEKLQEEIRNVTGLKKEVLEIFHTLWENYEQKIINILVEKGDPRVLIHGSVDPHAVIKAIRKSIHCRQVAKYFKGTKFHLPKGTIHYNTEILLLENQTSYFLYLFIIYCNLTAKNKKVSIFVESALHLIKSISQTCHIQTKLWMLEVLYSLSERVSFKDLYFQNAKLRSEFQEVVKELLDDLTPVATKSRTFTHRVEIKAGIFNMFSKDEKETSLFDFVKIFPPTIHCFEQLYNVNTRNKRSEHVVHVDDDMSAYFLFSKWLTQTEEAYIRYLSIVTIKTYNKIFLPLLMNVFEQDLGKISSITKENLIAMLPLYEDKSEENQIYLETVAEFMHTLIQSHSLRVEIMKSMRKNIKDIYDGNDFFKCTKTTLNHWKNIIDCLTEGSDMLGELLSTGGLFDGIFTRKAEATRQKIKTFERVCFIIHSGRVDKYENKLRVVLESINEVMKSENPSPALLILILFCIRILFMRLSETSLKRMFLSIWPSLITLLIQIFTKEVFEKNTNLLLAGLKVIELVHALELEEFNIHRWIFIFDFFGIKLDSQDEEERQLASSPFQVLTPFKFKPILTRVLPDNYFKCEYLPEQPMESYFSEGKRKINIKEASIDSDEELRNHAFVMLQNMMDLNQRRAVAVREEIEDLIEADFISLDDYIFQLK